MDVVETCDEWDADLERLTEDEVEWLLMGPWTGGVPGLVRRVRRVLDLSQRGLAAVLGVSQSRVARWETARTSPPMAIVIEMLRRARMELRMSDQQGNPVEPMRDDGARDRRGRRHPAHVDLTARAWWTPKGSSTWGTHLAFRARSRRHEQPAITYHVCRLRKDMQRQREGIPVDHPSIRQFVAEVRWRDEAREERDRSRREMLERLMVHRHRDDDLSA